MLTACNVHSFKTKKALTEEQRGLKGFERIELLGSLDVKYEQADSFSVVVQAPEEVIDDVQTRVDGDRLVVNMKGSNKFLNMGVSDSKDVTVYVTSPDFLGIELKGSGDFECKKLLDTDNLDILLRGSGDISFDDVVCDRINVSLVGSGDVKVKHVKTLRSLVELIGSGDVKIMFDDSGDVDSRLTGSGDIELSGTVRNFSSNVRGSGDMYTQRLDVIGQQTETEK